MGRWSQFTRPPLRSLLLLLAIGALLGIAYGVWSPGKIIRDGRHDLGTNGIWIQHGWLGDDSWFERNDREKERFRNGAAIRQLAEKLRSHRVRYVFPHVCPCSGDGEIAPIDDQQTALFLDHFAGFDVVPWIGGVLDAHCSPELPAWRERFVSSTVDLIDSHPRFAGVQINIEPLPSGNAHFLTLLEELKAALPDGKILSVAAYPPPTRWHPFPDVHWEETYFRKVATRVDQIVPMMYDTAIRKQKLYQQLMCTWTEEVLAWSEDTQVLLGLPAYDDAGVGYHFPEVENLENALKGVHAALAKRPLPKNYAGIALYSEWEMDEQEWRLIESDFSDPTPGEG